MSVNKAIIAMAGFGTRRLPITKAIDKCMLPVGNRPIIDYVVQDCLRAGITEIILVVSDRLNQVQRYYERDEALESYLAISGKNEELAAVKELNNKPISYVTQDANQPYGSAVPLWLCRNHIKPGERFLYICGDQFFYNGDDWSETANFIDKSAQFNNAMLGVQVPHEDVYKYGILRTKPSAKGAILEGIVEKPKVEDAPSNLMNGSVWLFGHNVFEPLAKLINSKQTSEYLLTDVANEIIKTSDLGVIESEGEYLDCGTLEGWLNANRVVTGV